MAMQKRKAQRRKVKPKVGLAGTSGSGKTYSALRMACGYTGDWSKVCLIDTEGGRGELYADTTIRGIYIGEYDYIRLDPPFTPARYIEAIKTAESDPNIEAIIVDSMTHAWAGTGGMLDMKDSYAKSAKENDFTAWRRITPEHNKLVEAVLRSRCAVFATVRTKTEYVIEDVDGKKKPRKIGMAPVFRDGLEYEFTVFMDMSQEHFADATKDNTGIFEGTPFIPSEEHGQRLMEWLQTGKGEPIESPAPSTTQTPPPPPAEGGHKGTDPPPPANFDVAQARRTFFAAMTEIADQAGVPKEFAEEKGKTLVYKAMNVDSLSKLNPEQWASVVKSLDGLRAATTAAINKALEPAEEASEVAQ